MALITIREAARRLTVSRGLVYALVRAGKIRHERHGTGRGDDQHRGGRPRRVPAGGPRPGSSEE